MQIMATDDDMITNLNHLLVRMMTMIRSLRLFKMLSYALILRLALDDDDPPHSGGGVEEINAIFPSPATFGRADSKTSQQVDTPPPL